MEIKQVNTFLEICRQGSFQEASIHLALTQPALSRQIFLLEQELGVTLFDRSSRKIRLTPAGHLFREKAGKLKRVWKETLESFTEQEGPSGEYRISSGGTIAAWILPTILLEIRKKFPDIRFRIYEGDTNQTRQSVTFGDVDLAILSGPVHDPRLTSSFFLRDRIVPVVRKAYPGLRGKLLPQDLKNEDFVLFHSASDIRRAMEIRFQATGLHPDPVMEVRSLGSVIRSVEAGLGVGFLSDLSLSPKLRILDIPELTARRDFYFCTRPDPGKGLLFIIEWMRNWAAQNLPEDHLKEEPAP